MAGIPVIDLQLAAAAPEEAARLRDAAQRLGCFRVAGHGVPRVLQDDMKAAVRALFDLPDDAKRRNADVISGSGYVAPSATNPLYEAFGLYDAASPADVDAFCASLHAPPHIRETIRRYAEKTHGLIVDVAAKLAAGLGLEEPEADRMFQDWPCQFRINRYNYTPDTVGETGVQVHTDSGFLTVLQEDDRVGGLEVADLDTGEFAPVDPVPGTFLVNLGDVATKSHTKRSPNMMKLYGDFSWTRRDPRSFGGRPQDLGEIHKLTWCIPRGRHLTLWAPHSSA
ncbi:2-oxoglutarate-dependent dioxygenase DAO isoform X2 [Aegilops tauschii subsp. strangulata]|uniref:2-oxoglutarate-dependent dioxygenase DAO isoform X2 n=1 Tax=Aegilops tauschii subsp. strangulata TaxID=200361 RepID=UPI003CC86F22